MYLYNEIKNINSSFLLKKFKVTKVILEKEWMPIRKWKHKNLPSRVTLEHYSKNIRTKGNLVKKEAFLLREGNKLLSKNWRFEFIPSQFKIDKQILFCKIPKNYFCITSIKNEVQFDNLLLPNKVKLTSEDYMAAGLLQGEMISSFKEKSRHYFSFTNSEYKLINNILKFLSKFNINKDTLSYQIIVNCKNGKTLSDIKYTNYWSKKLEVPIKKFVKINYNFNYKTSKKYGSMSIKYYNTQFRLFMQYYLEMLKERVEVRKKLARSYLMGLIAAEGGVNLSSNLTLNYISIGGSKKADTQHYKKVLNVLGIKSGKVIKSVSNEDALKKGWKRGNGGYTTIQGIDNFMLFYKNKIITTPFKYLNFLIGMVNHKKIKKSPYRNLFIRDLQNYRKKHSKIYNKIMENKNRQTKREKEVYTLLKTNSPKDISKKLGILLSSTHRILSSMERKKIVKREKLSRHRISYSPA